MAQTPQPSFSPGTGRWLGAAEVYDGAGRFLGNASDSRHVRRLEDGRIRIDVSFMGPFKFSGYYTIATTADHGSQRVYEGPANVGYAETLAEGLVDANAYWPVTGLSQRFFLMVLPGAKRQLSLALMSRGERLLYVVAGENQRVTEASATPPGFVSGASFDLADDPGAGRGEVLLHREGVWTGELTSLDAQLREITLGGYREVVTPSAHGLEVTVEGAAFDPAPRRFEVKHHGSLAWVPACEGSLELAGSYSLSGGRALSGHMHHLRAHLRVWRREVASGDGTLKAVLHTWYRGGERVGVQFGVLAFKAGDGG